MKNNVAQAAIMAAEGAISAFCKFVSPNDTKITGGHQAGYLIGVKAWKLMFDRPGIRGSEILKKSVTIKWNGDFETQSVFTYYGSKGEYRLTRFGKGFPFLTEDNVGDLLVLAHIEGDQYVGFILQTDEDIEDFFAAFNLTSDKTNALIEKAATITAEEALLQCFMGHVKSFRLLHPPPGSFSDDAVFPTTKELAQQARECFIDSYNKKTKDIEESPDSALLSWINAEYELFKAFENDRYSELIRTPFASVAELVNAANSILNRRKSRAGKSLEHHLSAVFKVFNLAFDEQAITERKNKPDFIFPSAMAYHNPSFESSKLIVLASKTTCKDRWRQIASEADRVSVKYLFTLQQGISKNQLNQMSNEGVRLVVPHSYVNTFPKEYRASLFTLETFVQLVKEKQR